MTTKYAPFIKSLRKERKLSQQEVAEKMAISRSSYIAIEQGKREFSLAEAKMLASLFGISLDELMNTATPNYEKYKQMILAFLRLGGKVTKTKLAKLLYFADFGWFYNHLHSMSGMQYRKMQYEPWLNHISPSSMTCSIGERSASSRQKTERCWSHRREAGQNLTYQCSMKKRRNSSKA